MLFYSMLCPATKDATYINVLGCDVNPHYLIHISFLVINNDNWSGLFYMLLQLFNKY